MVVPCEARKVGELLVFKMKLREVVDGVCQATRDAESALERVPSKKEVKDGFVLVNRILPITVGHGELVEVR